MISAMLFLLMACRKQKTQPADAQLPAFVYRAGLQVQTKGHRAVYIKNTELVPLVYHTSASTVANDIYVAGNDVYVVGSVMGEGEDASTAVKALLWKNGEVQELATPSAKSIIAHAVFVSGTDVYVAGNYVPNQPNAKRRAVIWKNGVLINIGESNVITQLEDIFVAGNDVYVVGNENRGGQVIAKYWKNGIATTLSQGEERAYAQSIYVDRSDVYITGYTEDNTAKSMVLWKNGVSTVLASGTATVRGQSVTVNNGDVYVAGEEVMGKKFVPRVFKNNELLTIEHSTTDHAFAYEVQVVDGNVYVMGHQDNNGLQEQVVWKNGKIIDLLTHPITQMEFYSMFIAK